MVAYEIQAQVALLRERASWAEYLKLDGGENERRIATLEEGLRE